VVVGRVVGVAAGAVGVEMVVETVWAETATEMVVMAAEVRVAVKEVVVPPPRSRTKLSSAASAA
jgi:hypothetical protein